MINPVAISQNKLKQIRKLKQRKYRAIEKCYFCEGSRLLSAALASDMVITDIVITKDFQRHQDLSDLVKNPDRFTGSVYQCSEKQMTDLSEEVTPPGLLFLVRSELKDHRALTNLHEKRVVYLENISDPGNLGTIIRSALWFDVNQIILSPGCVDPLNPKVIRASAGAIFFVDIFQNVDKDKLFMIFDPEEYAFVASTPAGNLTLDDCDPGSRWILFLGSEANGLSKEVLGKCDIKVRIPGNNRADSLNVASSAGIFLYHLAHTQTAGERI